MMTMSPTTSGELAKPQSGTFLPVSDAGLRDQSVSIRTPRTMPSRLGPRKPGQLASVFAPAELAERAISSSLAGADTCFSEISAAAGADAGAAGPSLA